MQISEAIELLSESGLSPEQLAPMIGVSNMTYRRWLQRESDGTLNRLQEFGVREAIFELKKQGKLKRGEGPSLDDDFTDQESMSILEVYLKENSPDIAEKTVKFDTFLHKLLKRLGSSPSSIAKIERGSDKIKAFVSKNPIAGSIFVELHDFATAEHSTVSKLVAVGALLYFLLPFDVIPDFTAGVGYLDDCGLGAYALTFCKMNAKKNQIL